MTLLVAAVHAPNVLATYAFSDDYPLLAGAGDLGPSVTPHVLAGLRPLYAGLIALSFGWVDDVSGLSYLRGLGVVGVCCTASVVFVALTRNRASTLSAAGLSAGVAFLPAFTTFASWASTWPYGYATAAAGAGSLLLSVRTTRPYVRFASAVCLIAAAFATYQPAAMFVWVPLGIRVAAGDRGVRELATDFRRHLFAAFIGCASGALVARLWAASAGVELLARAEFVTTLGALGDKAQWFLTRPLAVGARPFLIGSPSLEIALLTAGPVLAVTAIGLYLLAVGSPRDRALRVVMAGAIIPLSMAPNLLVRENQIEFRILPALTAVMLIFAVYGLHGCLSRLFPSGSSRYLDIPRSAAICGLLGAAGGLSAWHITSSVLRGPAIRKEQLLRAQLRTFDPRVTPSILFVAPHQASDAKPNIGIFSTPTDLSHPWVPRPDVLYLLREDGVVLDGRRISVTNSPARPRPGEFLVDGAHVQREVVVRRTRGS